MCSCTVGIIRKMFSNTIHLYCKVIVSFPLLIVSELLKCSEQHIPEQCPCCSHIQTWRTWTHRSQRNDSPTRGARECSKNPQSAFQFILKVLDGSRLGTLGKKSWTRFLNLGQPFPYEEYCHVENRKETNTNCWHPIWRRVQTHRWTLTENVKQ